ncbi:MAG: hypothetical protein DMD87_25320 [Candidatus Rokuibacteriota bacterium]|nr:MAG: hypothetical protein DMD87_25320 [Candidatus Rokubacteria bacterium]
MPWNPSNPAVIVEPAHAFPVTLIRHDGYPYEETWDENATGWTGLFDIANRYLAIVNARLNLPAAWLNDLREQPTPDPRPQNSLLWLRDQADPRHSFWVERHAGLDAPPRPRTGTVLDRTAVLVAGLCRMGSGSPLYGGQGLKVLAQTGPHRDGLAPVRIAGVCSTLPLPVMAQMEVETFRVLAERIAAVFALPDEVAIVDVGVSLPSGHAHEEQSPIIFAKTAPPSEYSRAKYSTARNSLDDYSDDYSYEGTSYLLVIRVNPEVRGGLELLTRRPLIAFADANVFVQDPVSGNGAENFTQFRPSRSWLVLDAGRVNVAFGNLPPGAGGMVQLVDPDPNDPPDPDFRVLNSRLVDPPLADNVPKQVPSSVNAHVRTNTFAAVNAFYHTSDLFKRMRQYGLPPDAYFRFVTRPVDVRYRAGIIPGFGDGRTMNAQVRWTLRPDTAGAWTKGAIEMRYALGDLESSVGRLPANLPSAVERSPLGLASDPRWCWHEACHVLLTAAVGDLEFRFAHSAGDAMAAILSDPESKLASDSAGAATNDRPWRGVTFPWVFIPRRHDRDVRDGWSWTGPLNRREMYFSPPGLFDKRGYWTEQILSSSLFRLYRAIGGDSEGTSGGKQVPAKAERQNAADYAVYLIMRAIESLGAAAATASTEPHHFVDAMRKADTATASAAGPGGYIGGTVHKVIQWAFERQGLYAAPGPASLVAGPEELATVDLHIQDLRPQPDGPYSPVDLLGKAWHAHPDSIKVKASIFPWVRRRKIRVKVQNRGATAASDTRVDVWVAPVSGGLIPSYPDAQWQPLGSDTDTVPAASEGTPGEETFGPFSWTPPAGPAREYAILAAASCDADRSNIDPATGYPCLTVTGGPIQVLVGCDNNLGLTTLVL